MISIYRDSKARSGKAGRIQIVDARARLAAHRRENIKLMGLKRVNKTVTVADMLNGQDEALASSNAEAVNEQRGGQIVRYKVVND